MNKGKGNIKEQFKRRYERNKAFVKSLKEKCSACGYNKHTEILHFHHLRDKKFELNNFSIRSQKSIREEVEKCILLCPNCHAEKHLLTIKH